MAKLTDAINDLMTRIAELLEEEQYSDYMLERVYRMREEIVDPAVRALRARPKYAAAGERLHHLYKAVEEYVVCYNREPDQRTIRRQKIEGLRAMVRRSLLPSADQEGEVEHLLDEIRRWQVKTGLDAHGRLVYSTAGGAVVPARSGIAGSVGPQVIDQAVKAQQPYADRTRPRDVLGNPGGLVFIETGERAIVVGDLHGRYDNLEAILKDKDNLNDILSGKAHLIFTGDAVHPRSSKMETPDAYEDSFCVMLLIMTLKAENPFNIHYLVGNHDNAHVGGLPAGRGQVRQDALFHEYVVKKFGETVYQRYVEFVNGSPVVAKLKAQNGFLLLVHAGLTPSVLSEQGLINIFIKGRQGPELQELLWGRNYDHDTLLKCLKHVGAKFIISGHTPPRRETAAKYGLTLIAEPVFAHVHDLQVILSAQSDIFGYADLDLRRPLPEKATELLAADGSSSFRLMGHPIAAAGDASDIGPAEDAK